MLPRGWRSCDYSYSPPDCPSITRRIDQPAQRGTPPGIVPAPELHPRTRIETDSPMSESPARHLNLAGASNFRDLGGYPTKDGRTLRWRQIFRSNHLGHLTDDDVSV